MRLTYWTFSDIFSENYFPSKPFHGGFGLLSLHGIAKPAYQAFSLLHSLGTEHAEVEGMHPNVKTWVSRSGDDWIVLATNHAPPRRPIRSENVRVTLTHAMPVRGAFIARIDENHTNPRAAWEKMGSPTYPTNDELEALQGAATLERTHHDVHYEDGRVDLEFDLPPHGVAAITLETAAA